MVYAPADAANIKSMRLDHAWTVDRWTLTRPGLFATFATHHGALP
jgi:hypothetical protein